MLELSRQSSRTPINPLTQPDIDRSRFKIAFIIVVTATFAFFLLNAILRGIGEERVRLPHVGAARDMSNASAPYAAVRSDVIDPRAFNGLERARQAARARYEATGGKTANSSSIDNDTGKIGIDLTQLDPLSGYATREQAVSAARSRLTALSRQLYALDRSLASNGANNFTGDLRRIQARATAAVDALATPGLSDREWLARQAEAASELALFTQQIDKAKAAH